MQQRLSDAIADYEQFRRSEHKAHNTIANDRQTLVKFLTSTGNIYAGNVTDRHVTEYLTASSMTRGAGTAGIDITVLRGFFTWCRRTRRIPRDCDPVAGRSAPHRVDRERMRVPVGQFPALLDAAGRRSPRDRAFVALALYTLSRSSEITACRVSDLSLESQRLRVRVTKGHREDSLPVSSELDGEMRRWLVYYAESCGSLEPDWYLVPARSLDALHGRPGAYHGVSIQPRRRLQRTSSLVVQPALQSIGFVLPDRDTLAGEGAHTLRRSGARALFDRLSDDGYDRALRIVQSVLHHKHMAMTEHYIGLKYDRHMRDEILAGQSMYGLPSVTRLRSISQEGTAVS